jgi:hypothetical protein
VADRTRRAATADCDAQDEEREDHARYARVRPPRHILMFADLVACLRAPVAGCSTSTTGNPGPLQFHDTLHSGFSGTGGDTAP